MGINQIQSLKGQSLLAPAIILSPAVIIENLALKLKMASTLEDIAELFATKTTNLKRCVEIRSAGRVTLNLKFIPCYYNSIRLAITILFSATLCNWSSSCLTRRVSSPFRCRLFLSLSAIHCKMVLKLAERSQRIIEFLRIGRLKQNQQFCLFFYRWWKIREPCNNVIVRPNGKL